MKKILLIDADSLIPNIALGKLSMYHKLRGDSVTFVSLNIPYHPQRRYRVYQIAMEKYDIAYCSVVFDDHTQFIKGDGIIFGGTGYDLKTILPSEVDKCEVDYSLWPDNDTSYGFITRGCIRKCSFCKVPEKEGAIHQVAEIKDIVRHKKVKFMDNNILAYSYHGKILQELIDMKVKCCFNQGLDIRLVTKKNSALLRQMNYLEMYAFAFDNIAYLPAVERGLNLMPWLPKWKSKFFVYVHPDMPISATISRLEWLKNKHCHAYVMRDKTCFNSGLRQFYNALASWCNSKSCFAKMTFNQFLDINCPKGMKKLMVELYESGR